MLNKFDASLITKPMTQWPPGLQADAYFAQWWSVIQAFSTEHPNKPHSAEHKSAWNPKYSFQLFIQQSF